ncbi:antibiotic biosynthesis monooxygenase [Flavobacterium granuli]|uniref:Quinol monooxygenase YgiN n=1 Tax=Flavobacterium granuli TaxID=280093 RepID=A0ABU1S5N4_9FLAO|nr:antibiotic biosynthesis monooxygenase [Flavobacterium granuli]MDR6845970.1 quinol monooxygenase YgiN [Flavobacterium granuli]
MKAKTHLSISKIALAIFTTLFVLCSTFATAQNLSKGKVISEELKNQEMIAKITRYGVKKEFQEKFQKAVSDYVSESLQNDSNIMSEAYFEQDNQTVIWLFERWTNQKELNKFKSSSKSKTVIALEKSALIKPEKVIYVKDLEPISKQEWRRASKAEDNQLTIMLFVDAKPGTEENFKAVYHTAMPQFRSEPGVVTYQLSQLNEDKTQFVTFEKFRSNDAFQYHLNFPPIQPVIDYLNTSIKKQPFQDGIHNLIEFAPLIHE